MKAQLFHALARVRRYLTIASYPDYIFKIYEIRNPDLPKIDADRLLQLMGGAALNAEYRASLYRAATIALSELDYQKRMSIDQETAKTDGVAIVEFAKSR